MVLKADQFGASSSREAYVRTDRRSKDGIVRRQINAKCIVRRDRHINVAAPAAEFTVIPATKIAAVSTDLRMNQPLWSNATSQFSVNHTVGVNTPPSFIKRIQPKSLDSTS